MNNKDRYEKWKKYIGCGNPDARIWIIGIEEGGGWDEDNKPIDHFNSSDKFEIFNANKYGSVFYNFNDSTTNDQFKRPSPVWTGALKILKDVFFGTVPKQELIRSDSNICLANIYPLGKPSETNWPEEYEDVIGKTHKEYLKEMNISRSELFPKLIENKIVIFHGKGSWKMAHEILGANQGEFKSRDCIEKYKDGWLIVNEERKMIFTRHFARGMPDALLTEIGQIVRRWHSES